MSESTRFTYDVLISYSHDDEEWVAGTLLPRLEGAGLKVCIDYRDFKPGVPSVKEMRRGVETSHKTVLVLTQAYLESAWAEFEQLMLQTLDPANRARRLIPLLKEKCDLPLEIRYLTYVDFSRPDREAIAWTQLLTALGVPPVQEAPEEPTRAAWCLKHPYPMPPNFTGRVVEREMLSRWLEGDLAHPLLVVRALGGFGKSALAWHWLTHDVGPARWPRVVWWGFYDEPGFEAFLGQALAYLGVDPRGLGPRQQIDALLRLLHGPGMLLILDGFERALRAYSGLGAAYQGDAPSPGPPPPLRPGSGQVAGEGVGGGQRDCVSPLAEHFLRGIVSLPGIRAKVLMTTRLRPRILEAAGGDPLQGCCEEELTQMQPADAVAFFRAQGVRGARAEIERACAPYGYHPLSLRLVAGLVARDPQQPGDIAAARRLDVSGDLVSRRHHVLEQAYGNLTPDRQTLLSRIACFRGPVRYDALRALAEAETSEVLTEFDADLRDLVARGLLHHDRRAGRYDLHPIVRRYAYDRLGGAERQAAHGQLRDYFAAVPEPERVQRLEDLAPVVELYHHTVRAGLYDEAWKLYRDRLATPIYFHFGAYQTEIELLRALFPDGEGKPPRLKDESAQGWTLNALANSYSLSGQPQRAVSVLEVAIPSAEQLGEKGNLAVGLGNLAIQLMAIGALRAAEANLRRRVDLSWEIGDEFREAIGHAELGRLLTYLGRFDTANSELQDALSVFGAKKRVQDQCYTWAYRALRALLLARASRLETAEVSETSAVYVEAALAAARRALELADEWQRQVGRPNARDYVDVHWLLGAAHRANGSLTEADRHLNEALSRCRRINMVDHEADILLDLARLRAATGDRDEALRCAQEALIITERSGYVLQGADVCLFLAQMAQEDGDEGTALKHAREARRLATCDGPPDYTYKVAYEEAGALLTRLGAEP
jgi:tetratricopeptide (TPR) repeat protein